MSFEAHGRGVLGTVVRTRGSTDRLEMEANQPPYGNDSPSTGEVSSLPSVFVAVFLILRRRELVRCFVDQPTRYRLFVTDPQASEVDVDPAGGSSHIASHLAVLGPSLGVDVGDLEVLSGAEPVLGLPEHIVDSVPDLLCSGLLLLGVGSTLPDQAGLPAQAEVLLDRLTAGENVIDGRRRSTRLRNLPKSGEDRIC